MKLITFCKCAAAITILLAGCVVLHAATVTLDAAATTAASDTAVFEPKFVMKQGNQIGLYIQNTTIAPQKLIFKITGLQPGRYDLYVNWGGFSIQRNQELARLGSAPVKFENIEPGYVVRDKDASELAAGIEIPIPGRTVPERLVRCITATQPKVKAAYDNLKKSTTEEPGRAKYTLRNAVVWTGSATAVEESYRAAQVFIAPAGKAPEQMEWRSRQTEKGTGEAVERACHMLQQARATMYGVLTDPLLRETVLEALTPVDVSIHYTKQNGVKVQITNNCDLDINGAVKVNAPTGWEAKAKKPTFVGLKSGESWTQSFKLTPASKGQAVPNQLSVAATIKVADKDGFAKLQIVRYVDVD